MHAVLYITMNLDEASSSKEARESVHFWLCENGFVEKDGYFRNGPADWFVIGGRWSGELSRRKLFSIARKHGKLVKMSNVLKKEYPKFAKFFGDDDVFVLSDEVLYDENHPVWMEFKEKYSELYKLRDVGRNPYFTFGYEDDAQVVDDVLFDELDIPKAMEKDLYDGGKVIDINGDEPTKESFIGRKWIVVVDFHY